MTLISARQARINAGLPALRKNLPAKDRELYRALEQAKKTITSILQNVSPEKIKCQTPNDLYKVAVSLAALVRAQGDIERWNAEKHGFLEAARNEWIQGCQEELGDEPELLEEFMMLLGKIEAAQKKKAEAQSDTE